MRLKKVLIITGITLGALLGVVVIAVAGLYYFVTQGVQEDPFTPLYVANCAVCHGESFEGSAQGPALVGRDLVNGDSVTQIAQSISQGFPDRGMPGWAATLNEAQMRSLAILIAERRVDRLFTDFKVDKELSIPEGSIKTELASFRIEVIATGIDPKPFSIAPLPDGSILLTEKIQGLSIVSSDGEKSEPITGTPETWGFGFELSGLDIGLGWLLDVAPHPDYAENGWIYLVHTDLCETCKGEEGSFIPTTMNRLVRGRIEDGEWRDQEVIWSVPQKFYSYTPDIAAGGRLAFDPDGYVFVAVGLKGATNYSGMQDLSSPYGKIHRVHDDGRIPADNPFVDVPGAMASIWTYGHRSPQGLEFDLQTRTLWGSEMGPRGGDEVNLLRPGRNYGWPLYSKGVDYDGTPVEYWKELNIEFDLVNIEQPVVDLTSSPAVSSFIIYDGAAFPGWQGSFLVGSLKERTVRSV